MLRKRSGAREEAVATGYSTSFVTVPELSITADQEWASTTCGILVERVDAAL